MHSICRIQFQKDQQAFTSLGEREKKLVVIETA